MISNNIMPFHRNRGNRARVSTQSRNYLERLLKESIQDKDLKSEEINSEEHRSWNVIAACCQELGLDFYTILVEIFPQDIDKIKALEKQLRKPH